MCLKITLFAAFLVVLIQNCGCFVLEDVFRDRVCITGKMELQQESLELDLQDNAHTASYVITKEDVEEILGDKLDVSFQSMKHPSALIQELATFNKIDANYLLKDEVGPPHNRFFVVKLKLGKEAYLGSGKSHKEAKMNAALEAYLSTKYEKPVSKNKDSIDEELAPMVYLNTLSSKNGYKLKYEFITWKEYEAGFSLSYTPPNVLANKPKSERHVKVLNISRMLEMTNDSHITKNVMDKDSTFYVLLTLEDRKYYGKGFNKAMARNSATLKALQDLEANPFEELSLDELDEKREENKSPLSKLNEISTLCEECKVEFNLDEEGPSHDKIFTATLTFLEMKTEGKANKKKLAKQNAAEKMLDEIQLNFPHLLLLQKENTKSNKNKIKGNKKSKLKKSNLDKITDKVEDIISSTKSFLWPANAEETKNDMGGSHKFSSFTYKSKLLNLLTLKGGFMNFYAGPDEQNGQMKSSFVGVNTIPPFVCYGKASMLSEAEEFAAAAMYKTLQNFGLHNIQVDENQKFEHIRDYKELLESFQHLADEKVDTKDEL